MLYNKTGHFRIKVKYLSCQNVVQKYAVLKNHQYEECPNEVPWLVEKN